MLIKECPMCGCREIIELPEIGCRCTNCDEVFKYDEQFGLATVNLEEWIEHLNNHQIINYPERR